MITKFPKAKNYTGGEPGLILKISKQVSAEKIYLAETKREQKVRILINSAAESRRKPCAGTQASGCAASPRKGMGEQREITGTVGELWAKQKIVLMPLASHA